jgi:hypothetical protein
MPDNPNPQGKGQLPLLQLWESNRPQRLAVKKAHTLLGDYLASLLVLSAEFRFKPVAGTPYHLYRRHGRWRLSLVAPSEWTTTDPGVYVGSCSLRPDMTWTLTPSADIHHHPDLVADLTAFVRQFVDTLASRDTLEAGLPFYVSGLPFYQRLLATGLASSVQKTAQISGLGHKGAAFWLGSSGPAPLSLLTGAPDTPPP